MLLKDIVDVLSLSRKYCRFSERIGEIENVASAQPHLWFFNKVKIFVRIGKGWAPKSLKTATNLDDVFV